jgi:hypothetical protein
MTLPISIAVLVVLLSGLLREHAARNSEAAQP